MSFLATLAPSLIASALPSLLGSGAEAATGAATNGLLEGAYQQNQTYEAGLEISQMQNQEQLDTQSMIFNEAMDERSENMHEINTLRNISQAQDKANDDVTKKFISEISGS